jgi:lipoic acid synthetase
MAIETLVLPERPKKPKWLRVKLPVGKKYTELRGLVDKYKLNTICASGSCPNMGECWGEGTATFMILGNICTRSCGFCGVKTAITTNTSLFWHHTHHL